MRIVAILGSPRSQGNSTILADTLTGAAEQRGAKVARYVLNDMKVRGCQACSACKGKSERCVVKDDLAQVLEDVVRSEVVVLATPVYWGEVSGQMKLFIDRTYSFLKPGFMDGVDMHRLPPGKKLVWIQTQGADDAAQFGDILSRYDRFFSQLRFFQETHILRACGLNNVGAVNLRPELLEEARALGQSLLP